jgi:hypothetical protein
MTPKPLDIFTISELRELSEILGFTENQIKGISKKELRETLSKELAKRLCRCEKGVQEKDPKRNLQRAIGICIKSVIRNRGVKIQSFQCRKKPFIISTRKQIRRNQNRTRKQSKHTKI